MIITPSIATRCATCNHVTSVSTEVYGCDACEAVFDNNHPNHSLDVYYRKTDADHKRFDFCSWPCLFGYLHSQVMPRMETDNVYFISFPTLDAGNIHGFLDGWQQQQQAAEPR